MDDETLSKVEREFGFSEIDGAISPEGLGRLGFELKRLGVVCHFDVEGRYVGCQANSFADDGSVVAQAKMGRVAAALQRYYAIIRSR